MGSGDGSVKVVLSLAEASERELYYRGNHNGYTITALRKTVVDGKKNLLQIDNNLIRSLGYKDIEQLRQKLGKIKFKRRGKTNAFFELTMELKT